MAATILRAANRFSLLLVLGAASAFAATNEPAITTGSADGARAYYTNLSKIFTALAPSPGATTIDDVTGFLGYAIPGQKLETLDPEILMSPDRLVSESGISITAHGLVGATLRDGDILAARFFAPKIVNVNTNELTPGWRKLIRLRARPDSPAARAGVESSIILFNFLAAATNQQPFSGHSFNTQVMLLAPSLPDRLYWLDFDPQQKLTLALNASFDAALLQSTGNHNYFVPDGCNACHGSPGNFAPPMVNYLDTDHWFDRIEDDFKPLKAAGTPLLFDAQTNEFSQPSFARAFDVIRRFNEEALLQNSLVRQHSFEAEAARTWLRLHAQSDEHFPPVARGFALNGGQTWQPGEAEGLGKLNQYCFRCHGSVHFSIFDRPTVVAKAGELVQHIAPNTHQISLPGFKMPPDRTLDPQEAQALSDFLNNLK